MKDPRAGIREVTGKTLACDVQIELVDEGDEDWCFVLLDPAMIDGTLPAPVDARSAVENDVYAMLRDRPSLTPGAVAEPVAFLRERLGVDVGGIHLRKEPPGMIVLVLPGRANNELSDEMLDLVAGGGSPNCQTGKTTITFNQSNGNG
jgi:hypothetical protein